MVNKENLWQNEQQPKPKQLLQRSLLHAAPHARLPKRLQLQPKRWNRRGRIATSAAGDTVKKLVQGFISPVVQFIVGSQKGLEAASTHIEIAGRSADFAWGAFVSSLITLVATAFVIYLIIHFLKLDRLDKKKD